MVVYFSSVMFRFVKRKSKEPLHSCDYLCLKIISYLSQYLAEMRERLNNKGKKKKNENGLKSDQRITGLCMSLSELSER